MIANFFIFFGSLLIFCSSVAIFSLARSNQSDSALFSVSPYLSSEALKNSEERIKKIEAEAQEKIEQLQQLVEEKISNIREQVEQRITESDTITDEDAERLRQQADIEEDQLDNYAQKEAGIIQYIAAKQIIFLINTAEEEATKLRAKARQEASEKNLDEALQDKIKETALNFELFTPTITPEEKVPKKIDTAWKNQIQQEFNRNISLLKKIILAAEVPAHAEELSETLTEQSTWFDNTLRSAEYVHDAQQEQVIQKNNILNKIIMMQKKAGYFIELLAKSLNLTENEKKKINLAILYDLGSLVQKNLSIAPIPDEDIKTLVVKTVREFAQNSEELLGLSQAELLEKINTQKSMNLVQQELSSTQNRLEHIRQEQKAFKNSMQKTLEATTGQALEAELLLRQSQEEITNYKDKIKQLTMSRKVDDALAQKTFTNKLEDARKTSLELQKTLDKTNQEIENIRKETKETSAKVYTELKQRFMPLLEEKERTNLELELIIQDTKTRAQELTAHIDNAQLEKQKILEGIERKNQELLEHVSQEQQQTSQDTQRALIIDKEENSIKSQLFDELAEQTITEALEDKNRKELERELDNQTKK